MGASVSGMASSGEAGTVNGTYHRVSKGKGTSATGHPALAVPDISQHFTPLSSTEVPMQLINLQLPWLFLVTDPICSLLCVQHVSVSIPYLQFKLETGVTL